MKFEGSSFRGPEFEMVQLLVTNSTKSRLHTESNETLGENILHGMCPPVDRASPTTLQRGWVLPAWKGRRSKDRRVGGLQNSSWRPYFPLPFHCHVEVLGKYSRLKWCVYVIISSFQWSCRVETFHGRWCQSSLLLVVGIWYLCSWHADMWVFPNFSMLFSCCSRFHCIYGHISKLGMSQKFTWTASFWETYIHLLISRQPSPKNHIECGKPYPSPDTHCLPGFTFDSLWCQPVHLSLLSVYHFVYFCGWYMRTTNRTPPKKDDSGGVQWI